MIYSIYVHIYIIYICMYMLFTSWLIYVYLQTRWMMAGWHDASDLIMVGFLCLQHAHSAEMS